MQIFEQGKDKGWRHIYYKIEYETARNGSKLGIKWKISWTIDKYYYFGYNIVADIWTEGQNYGRQIKANSPNRDSGTYETDWLWFDKGYGANTINACRIILKSTNGGIIPFDTGADRTVTAPIRLYSKYNNVYCRL